MGVAISGWQLANAVALVTGGASGLGRATATRFAAAGEPNGTASIDQGEEIGHPSRIELRWEGRTASIGGAVAVDDPVELSL